MAAPCCPPDNLVDAVSFDGLGWIHEFTFPWHDQLLEAEVVFGVSSFIWTVDSACVPTYRPVNERPARRLVMRAK